MLEIGEDDSPAEIAVRAIDHFCLDGGRFNNDVQAASAIVAFLGSYGGNVRNIGHQLVSLLKERPSLEQLRAWAERHVGE